MIEDGIRRHQCYILIDYQLKFFFPDPEHRRDDIERFAERNRWAVTFRDETALFQKLDQNK